MPELTVSINVWAIPQSTWQASDEFPGQFRYAAYLGDDKPYTAGASIVATREAVVVYSEENVVQAAIDALEEAIREEKLRSIVTLKGIHEKIASLLALEHAG